MIFQVHNNEIFLAVQKNPVLRITAILAAISKTKESSYHYHDQVICRETQRDVWRFYSVFCNLFNASLWKIKGAGEEKNPQNLKVW